MADVPSLSSVRQSVTPQGVRRTLGMELEPAVEADSVSPPTYTTAVALPTAPATPAGVVQLVKQAQAEIKKKVDSSEKLKVRDMAQKLGQVTKLSTCGQVTIFKY